MNFSLPPSIFFNLAKEKPIVISKKRVYTLGGKNKDNFLFLSGEKINLSESDTLSFFENEYKLRNDSKIKKNLSKILKKKYNVKITSTNKNLEIIDFIVNKVFYEYDHYYSIDASINLGNVRTKTSKSNYKLDVNIDFSRIENKSIFETIVDDVFLDSNSVFKLNEVADKTYINGPGDFVFLNNKYYLIQPTPTVLDSIEKKYQETLLNKLEKNELRNDSNLAKKLKSIEKQNKLKEISNSLNSKGYFEKNKKGIQKKYSKFIPYVTTDDGFLLHNKTTNKYFLLSKFRVALDISKSNGSYVLKGEPFVLEKKYHPFVYYHTDSTNWEHKKNDLGFHKCCFNGKFSVDSRYSPEKKLASALKSGIALIEKAYMPNVNPVHNLKSPKFNEISLYKMQQRGLKATNKR